MDHIVTTSVGVTQRNVVLEAWSEDLSAPSFMGNMRSAVVN